MSHNDTHLPTDTPLMELPFAHERDDELGWYYRDRPHGGMLAFARGYCEMRGREITLYAGAEFIDLQSACGEDGFLVEGWLAPPPDELHPDSLEAVGGAYMNEHEPDVADVASYGLKVNLGHEWGAETWEDGFDALQDSLIFGSFASGFPLDRAQNRIGMTGWDVIADAVYNESAHDKALERAREAVGD